MLRTKPAATWLAFLLLAILLSTTRPTRAYIYIEMLTNCWPAVDCYTPTAVAWIIPGGVGDPQPFPATELRGPWDGWPYYSFLFDYDDQQLYGVVDHVVFGLECASGFVPDHEQTYVPMPYTFFYMPGLYDSYPYPCEDLFDEPWPGCEACEETTVARDPVLAAGLELLPAAPNPFNPATTLRWRQEATAALRLEVLDLLGRSVALLHDGPAAAGEHEAAFDGAGLPSGVYMTRLSGEGRMETGKLLLLK